MGKHITVLVLAVAILALAQRLANYEDKTLAIVVAIAGTVLVLWFGVLTARDLIDRHRNRHRLQHKDSTSLELTFSAMPPYQWADGSITHYRVGLKAKGVPVTNAKIVVADITPRPRAGNFRADFPLALKHRDSEANTVSIPRDTEEFFELAASNVSGDGRFIVRALGRNEPIEIGRDEVWDIT